MPEQTNLRPRRLPQRRAPRPAVRATAAGCGSGSSTACAAAIQERRLVAGAALPPTRVLAAELGVSRSVVVEAYANLAADGYLEARRAPARACGSTREPTARGGSPQRDDSAAVFDRPRQASPLGAPPIRLIGGLPDPALFPRARWLRHYRAALTELPDPELTYPSTLGAEPLRVALAAYLGRVRGVATDAGAHARLRRLHAGPHARLPGAAPRRRAPRRGRGPVLRPAPAGDRDDGARAGARRRGRRRRRPRRPGGPRGRRGARRARALVSDGRHARRAAAARAGRLGRSAATR